MSQIAVLVFEQPEAGMFSNTSEDLAKMAYKELEEMVENEKVQIESATIVVKNDQGEVRLRRTSEWTAGKGAGRGAFWGLLIGLIFAGPVAGLLAGLGLGAIIGKRKAGGIDRDFMKQLGEGMRPGNSALFMLIPEEDKETLAQLEAYDATLHLTVLTDDVEEALDKAVEQEEVLEAIKYDAPTMSKRRWTKQSSRRKCWRPSTTTL
jgi:uncharacterized membrane protein